MSETGTDLAALLQAIEAAEGAVRELFPPTPLELVRFCLSSWAVRSC